MQKEILLVAEAVSGEKGLPQEASRFRRKRLATRGNFSSY